MNFSEEWDKLKNLEVGKEITTIRWNDYPVEKGHNVIIKLKGKQIAKGKVTQIERIRIKYIELDLIQKDTYPEMSFKKFYELLERFYHNKPGWEQWRSLVKIYYITITEVMN